MKIYRIAPMPLLTRLFIKASFVCFTAAFLLNFLLASRPVFSLSPFIVNFTPVFFHLITVGWLTQLIFGVAYWMFPVYSKERPRGSDFLAWATLFLLNGGLFLRAVAEPTMGWWSFSGLVLMPLSAVCQWLAGLAFVLNTWPRVKGK